VFAFLGGWKEAMCENFKVRVWREACDCADLPWLSADVFMSKLNRLGMTCETFSLKSSKIFSIDDLIFSIDAAGGFGNS
jgi:hypothetical protein